MSWGRSAGGLYVPLSDLPHGLGRVTVPSQVPQPELDWFPKDNSGNMWFPSNEQDLQDWSFHVAQATVLPDVTDRVMQVRAQVELELATTLAEVNPLSDNEVFQWASGYVGDNGWPQTPEQGVQMALGFLDLFAGKIGFHPSFMGSGAVDLLINFAVGSQQDAWGWMAGVGAAVANNFGLPLTADMLTGKDFKGLFLTGVSTAMTHCGFPYAGIVTLAVDSLWDGHFSFEEGKNLIGLTGSIVGGAIAGALGIFGPIGSAIGALISSLIFDFLGRIFGWAESEYDRRERLRQEAKRLAEQMHRECYGVARAMWLEYGMIWEGLINNLQASIDAQQEWLMMAHGLRMFGDASVDVLTDPSGNDHPVPFPIGMHCNNVNGCYYQPQTFYRRSTPLHESTLLQMPNIAASGGAQGAIINGRVDARAALAQWNARQFVTPFHALMHVNPAGHYLQGSDPQCGPRGREAAAASTHPNAWLAWQQRCEFPLKSDEEYLRMVSYVRPRENPADVEGCTLLSGWAQRMMGSLIQIGPAAALVQSHIMQTITQAVAEYQVRKEAQYSAGDTQLMRYEKGQIAASRAAEHLRLLRQIRRGGRMNTQLINNGLLAVGAGSLAGWAAGSLFGRR